MTSVSFWFEQLGGMPEPRPSLEGRIEADVCIVGGGYGGATAAKYLRLIDPGIGTAAVPAGGVPVPEPSSLASAAVAGLAGLGCLWRCRRVARVAP